MSSAPAARLREIREPVQFPESEHDVARALRDVMHTFRIIMEGEMRSRGSSLSFAHAMVLMAMAREPGLSGAQVARRTQVTAQTMNVLLRNLESVGYAVREPNPENKRADRWFLTQDGLRHMQLGQSVADGLMAKMLLPLSEKDADRLRELLQKCATALHAVQDSKAAAESRGKELLA
jgi:DNA-binding MarR family transcriptional regulator